jgi:hypothetical protein
MMNITLRWDGAANLGAWALDGMVKAIAVPGGGANDDAGAAGCMRLLATHAM